ncbi:MAG: YdeI/OmpD-associated family protein [Candidatus Acidiferrum sp.]
MKPKSKPNQKPKAPLKLVRKSFEATLERLRSNLGWVIIRIPFSVQKTWGTRGTFRVKGEINGFAFRTSLFPTRKGEHFLLVNKKMQAAAHAVEGTTAQFFLEPDTAERVIAIPVELKHILAEDSAFRRWFATLNYSIRKWLSDWITQPKNPASRVRRAEQVAEQLLSAMEAERELPPALKLAFTRDPRALEGWNLMSPLQRRGQLIAIFYYRSPDARTRRIDKVVESAIALAEKKFNK